MLFEMRRNRNNGGMLEKSSWISFPRIPVPSFEKSFQLKNKGDYKFFLEATAMGFYQCFINGQRITTDLFMPGYTSYRNRLQVQCYEVTSFLKEGKNEITFLLSEGYGAARKFGWRPYPYQKDGAALRFRLIKSEDEKERIILKSDATWDVYSSYIKDAGIYLGESEDKTAQKVYLGKAEIHRLKKNLIPQEGLPVREKEIIRPKRMFVAPNGETIVDFGQEFTGFIEITIKGERGEKIGYDYAEVLDKNGNFYRENYRQAKSYFEYTLSGKKDVFKPLFSFGCGRYIRLIKKPKSLSLSVFKGIVVYSDIKRIGCFKSQNEKINQLASNVLWSTKCNFLEIPTDCPQRDERLGWTGDIAMFVKTATYLFDVQKFLEKWLHDLFLEQKEDGYVEGICPSLRNEHSGKGTMLGNAGWGDAIYLVPLALYEAYGDREILKDALPHAKRYFEHLSSLSKTPYLLDGIKKQGLKSIFGDWLATDGPKGFYKGKTDKKLIATAFYALTAKSIAKIGEAIGWQEEKYEQDFLKIRNAYQEAFFEENGLPKGKPSYKGYKGKDTCYTQTALALTLCFGLYKDEKQRRLLAKSLADLIDKNNGLMSTGFIGTRFLLEALSQNGYSKKAFDLLFEERNPSWLFSVDHGATTIWEHWDSVDEDGNFWSTDMNSFNHYAYGSVFGWLVENAIGLKPAKAGFEEVVFSPKYDKRLGDYSFKYETPKGLLSISLKTEKNKKYYAISLPNGIKGTYIDQNGKRKTINKQDERHELEIEE